MTKWMLAAGAAALAMSAPSLAEKGQNKGGGNKDHAAHAKKADRGGAEQKARGGDKDRHQSGQMAQRDDNRGRGGDQPRAESRGERKDSKNVRADNDRGRGRDDIKGAKSDDNRGHGQGNGRDEVRVVRTDNDRIRVLDRDFDDVDVRFAPRWTGNGMRLGFVDGCPPGLAKKGNGCLPPGQARKLVGTRVAPALLSNGLVGPYRLWYRDDDDFMYRWDDDYIYRIRRDGDLIDAMFPFTNRDFYYYPVGVTYPDSCNYYNVPYQYRSYYPDGGDYLYRYGDGAIYMVDPGTQMISGIAALLTGAPLAVGQPLPPTYGVYNVPMAYRSTYYDTPDAMYRYNDGYIYRVDPATMLVTSVIDALV